jgi:hypothetical protein
MKLAFLGALARWMAARRPLYRGLALAVLAVLAVAVTVWPVKAAMQLAYFKATPTASSILLEWATLSEYNVDRFEILCKGDQELETAFHSIGFVDALGAPNQSVTYQFNVSSGLTPGELYCFRLHEITTDGEPGERFDLCGYGLGITPTPVGLAAAQTGQESVPLIPVADTSPTPTAVLVGPVGTVVPLPTIPTATATVTTANGATATPVLEQPASPLTAGGVTATPGVQPPQSPLAPPTSTPAPAVQSAPTAEPLAIVALAPPLSTPDPLAAAATATAERLAAAPPPPLPTVVAMPTPAVPAPPAATPTPPAAVTTEALALAQVAPTPVYLVVTATPTATPDRSLAALPLFTPLPTATPTEAYAEISQWLAPTSQNLMLMLLCFTFVGASGLGLMGLITSVIYMRSRSRRTPDDGGYSSRALRRRL